MVLQAPAHADLLLVMQILEIKTESPVVIGSISTLSQFYTENTPAARRDLRSNIENRSLSINESFLTAAEKVIGVRAPGVYRAS